MFEQATPPKIITSVNHKVQAMKHNYISSEIACYNTKQAGKISYSATDSFNVKFALLRYAAIQHPNWFTRMVAFEDIAFSISDRTQQRLLESLVEDGYLDRYDTGSNVLEYRINSRAFIPFLSLLHPIKQ